MHSRLFFLLVPMIAVSSVSSLRGQSPVIIQAQPTKSAAALATLSSPGNTSSHEATELLKQIKAANEETIKKQQTVLETLDELQKAADQIKIYSKRG